MAVMAIFLCHFSLLFVINRFAKRKIICGVVGQTRGEKLRFCESHSGKRGNGLILKQKKVSISFVMCDD